MKFLLLNPPMDYTAITKESSFEAYLPPVGLLYIASSLEKKGQEVKLIDFVAESFSKEKLKDVLSGIDAVGITITSQVSTSAKKLIDLIKEINPKIKVIIGGPHCTLQGKQVLVDMNADISVSGEGENTIVEIVDSLNGKKDLSKIHGVFYRENNKIKHGLPAEEIEDLDSIPFPSLHLIDKYNYGKEAITGVTFFAKGKIASIVTTRGCPFDCRFCVSKAITKKYRWRSAENVVKEFEEIAKKYDTVFVVDDNFLMNKKRAHKIMDLLIEKKLGIDIWIVGIRVTDADEEIFKKMKKAGVKSLEFGIESGNQDVLDYYNKRITLEKAEKAIKLSKKTGFFTVGNFIIGSPIEEKRHVMDTIKFAKKLNLDFAFFNSFYFLKGSEIWADAFKEGKIKENELFVPCDSQRGLCNFSVKELRDLISYAARSYYFRPRYVFDQFFRQIFVYRNLRVTKTAIKLFIDPKQESVLLGS